MFDNYRGIDDNWQCSSLLRYAKICGVLQLKGLKMGQSGKRSTRASRKTKPSHDTFI